MKPPTADLGHPHTPNLTKATSCRVIRAPISFSWSNELRNRECGTTLLVAEDAESATSTPARIPAPPRWASLRKTAAAASCRTCTLAAASTVFVRWPSLTSYLLGPDKVQTAATSRTLSATLKSTDRRTVASPSSGTGAGRGTASTSIPRRTASAC